MFGWLSNTDSSSSEQNNKNNTYIGKAKDVGVYFKSWTQAAVDTASTVASKLENTSTILGDFATEQERWISEQREKEQRTEAAVPPWVGYTESEQMRTEILALSNDKRNFLRSPPPSCNFQFDFTTAFPVAMAVLAEDAKLNELRFELVPKEVTEEAFWRNFFYRVSLIKQSTQLSSIAASRTSDDPTADDTIPSGRSGSPRDRSLTPKQPVIPHGASTSDDDLDDGGAPLDEADFASSEFADDAQPDEDHLTADVLSTAKSGVGGASGAIKSTNGWEEDFEVVSDSNPNDDVALEEELLRELDSVQ